MTQIIVTLEEDAPVDSIAQAIGLIRGVISVEVLNTQNPPNPQKESNDPEVDILGVPEDI